MDNQKQFQCKDCKRFYKRRSELNRHLRSRNQKFNCDYCQKNFNRKDSLKTHVRRFHSQSTASSENTFGNQTGGNVPLNEQHNQSQDENEIIYSRTNERENEQPLNDQLNQAHDENQSENFRTNEREIEQALDGSAVIVKIHPLASESFDLLLFFSNISEQIIHILTTSTQERRGIKWYLNARVQFTREKDGKIETVVPHFRSLTYPHLSSEIFNNHDLHEAFQKIFTSKEEFIMKGSDWIFQKVLYLEVHYVLYTPLNAGQYIKEPEVLRRTRSLVNIKNHDSKCFLYCILAKLYPVKKNANRVSHYLSHESTLNMSGLKYPVQISQVSKFERQNDISVNVFGYEENEIFPMRIAKTKRKRHVDLLFLKRTGKTHYCLIKNLSRFLHHLYGKTGKHKHYFCPYCLHGFLKKDALNRHTPFCMTLGEQKVVMPTPGENDVIEFKDIAKQLRVPFVIYADFETYVQPVAQCDDLDPNSSHTINLSKFEPCGFCYQVVSSDDSLTQSPVLYRGEDVVDTLLTRLLAEEERLFKRIKHIEPMQIDMEIEHHYDTVTHCHICRKAFGKSSIKVRNHDHLNGKFIGIAHRDCNLQYKQVHFIPVIFHNLRGFDGHLIIRKLGKYKAKKLKVIANTQERYVSFSVSKLRFIDSFQFLDASLDSLVLNLKNDDTSHFKQFMHEFQSEKQREMLLQKGIYPYSYVTDESKFNDRKLPPKVAFYNSMKKCHISDDEYSHAQKVWKEMKMETLGDYHDLYLKCDVLLLADVFERFRTLTIENFDLDPAQFYTLAGLCWSACLKMTGVRLELITDAEQFQMIEKGTRGGVAMITRRYTEANNKDIPDTFDETQTSEYFGYFDMNNLYGGAMVEPLPVGDFRWLSPKEIESDVFSFEENAKTGYILEVSLGYPSHLHLLHSDYPLAPTSLQIKENNLSPYCKKLYAMFRNTQSDGDKVVSKKLVPTLWDKEEYVVHYRNLQLYLKQGMVLKKIHRVIAFTQDAWLKPYIQYNTNMRKKATNKFDVRLYKAYNNIVFGKTMENIRLHMNFNLVNTRKGLLRLTSKPSFERITIFDVQLVGVKNRRVKLLLDKPIYTGMCVLDLSKLFMYQFHYGFIKKRYGDRACLLMTDIDSLFYSIKTTDMYKDMQENSYLFDT
ncbi:hypothetical protein FSP39_014172 [Pinctada imbricata]|uniref:C2H2-type domain-containing protein n=1 Tax=Pinctada imbricata TaxID=66713 RepID=A0AA88YJ41_PINIB|nr:hypothetical protein FSP39_014172 [Pinctada imbricata]